MSLIQDTLEEKLKAKSRDLQEFQQAVHRLLSNQVIYAEESNIERDIYFIFRQLEGEIIEVLGILGITLYHDEERAYVVAFAPGVDSPMIQAGEDLSELAGLRKSLSNDAIKLILLLRYHYDEFIKEGSNLDQSGSALLPIQALNQSFHALLRCDPPTGPARTAIFREAANLRLIDKSTDDAWNNPDGLLRIRPIITSMVYTDMIKTLAERLEDDEVLDADMPGEEDKDV
jgi:uncharacterized protein DUF4194